MSQVFKFPYQIRKSNEIDLPLQRYCRVSRVPDAITERFIDRLEPIRLQPERLLEIGSAGGHLRSQLLKRYPQSELISIESDQRFCLLHRPTFSQQIQRRDPVCCANASSVPLPSASVDMICLNLGWLNASQLGAVLRECVRVLRASGLLMAVAYGPQTLVELRECWRNEDDWQHTNEFIDMHELGDHLVQAGLSDVVADSERLLVECDNVTSLLRELRDIGGGNRAPQKRPGLTTKRLIDRLIAHYPRQNDHIVASVELVFAHAWLLERPGSPILSPQRQNS